MSGSIQAVTVAAAEVGAPPTDPELHGLGAGLGWSFLVSVGSGYVLQVMAQVVSFGTRLLLARLISPEHWGVYGEAMVVVGVLDQVRELNLTQWAISAKGEDIGRRWAHLSGALSLTTVPAMVFPLLILPVLAGISPDLPLTTVLLSLYLLPRAVAIAAETQLNYRLELNRLILPQVVGTLAFTASALILGRLSDSAEVLAVATTFQAATYAGTLIVYNRGRLQLRPAFHELKTSFLNARHFIGLALTSALLSKADGLIVGIGAGSAAAGFYLMAIYLRARLPTFFETPILWALLPVFARYRGDRLGLARLLRDSTNAIKLLETPWYFVLCFNAYTITDRLFGPAWRPAAVLLILVTGYPLLSPLGTVGWELLRMIGRTRIVFTTSTLTTLVLVGGGIVLTHSYGVVGMVIATYLAAVTNVFLIYALIQELGWSAVRQCLFQLGLIYLLCSIPMLGVQLLTTSDASRLVIDCALAVLVNAAAIPLLIPYARTALAQRPVVVRAS